MSVRRRAIKARVERDRERKRRYDETTASLNALLERVKADPEGVRAASIAAMAGLADHPKQPVQGGEK